MDPLTMMAIMSGIGGLSGLLTSPGKQAQEEDQRRVEGVKAKYYGYNKDAPQAVQRSDAGTDLISGLLSGASSAASNPWLMMKAFGDGGATAGAQSSAPGMGQASAGRMPTNPEELSMMQQLLGKPL